MLNVGKYGSIEALCAKYFTYITIFNPYNNFVRFLLPFTEKTELT